MKPYILIFHALICRLLPFSQLTNICRIEFPSLIYWTGQFPFEGLLGGSFIFKQTVETLIKRRILRRLVWVSTVCICPTKKTLGLNGLTFSKTFLSGTLSKFQTVNIKARPDVMSAKLFGNRQQKSPRAKKKRTQRMLSSNQNTRVDFWHFNIYDHDKFYAQLSGA